MSKKSELINVITGYKAKYEAVQADVTKVYESSDYTDEGKEKEANKIIAGLEATAKQSHDKALSIIDSALEGLSAKWRSGSTGKFIRCRVPDGAVKCPQDVGSRCHP